MDQHFALLNMGTSLLPRVAAIAKKRSRSPSSAVAQLCILTNSHEATTAEEWFDDVSRRYSAAKTSCFSPSDAAKAVDTVMDVLKTLPATNGGLLETFDSILNLVDYETMTTAAVKAFANAFEEQHGAAIWTPDAIARAFVNGPLADSMVPPQWWLEDREREVEVLRVAVRVLPPTLLVEYQIASTDVVRHRRVHLDTVFRERGPVTVLAKKISSSLSFTGLSQTQIESYLTRMQQLCNLEDDEPRPSAPQSTIRANDQKGKQKADLGYLYRDPEAALKNVDLQDADDMVIKEFKSKMDEQFLARKLKPGDPGYVYDVRKTFKPSAKSDWDEDDD